MYEYVKLNKTNVCCVNASILCKRCISLTFKKALKTLSGKLKCDEVLNGIPVICVIYS